jgi:hypothetical protein
MRVQVQWGKGINFSKEEVLLVFYEIIITRRERGAKFPLLEKTTQALQAKTLMKD